MWKNFLDKLEELVLHVSLLIPLKVFPVFQVCLYFITLFLFVVMTYWTKAYSEPCQTSKMERFTQIVNDWKSFILYSWQGSEYASAE